MDDRSDKMCVQMKEAYKRYRKVDRYILRGVNITVQQATIYSLLGPSGCGKTSVLCAMVGELKLDSGSIEMSINSKKQIGYMPQNTCVHEEFTIYENLYFYGHLYQMAVSSINHRIDSLLQLFQLPHKHSIVSHLSGGEKRRISLCMAVLHNPQLLILDEPTVGLDVIISHNVWQYLYGLSLNENKTIIITTHYIEEARHSNRIGLMRNGRILAEDNPEQIIEMNNSRTLEQAFLRLCELDNEDETKEVDVKLRNGGESGGGALLAEDKMLSLQRMYAFMLKNIFWMKRNIASLLFILVLPIVQCTLVSITIGEPPIDLSIALVNDELLVRQANRTCYPLPHITCNQGDALSCNYISKLQTKPLRIIEYNELNEAKEGLKHNKVWALLYFSENYTASLMRRLKENDLLEAGEIQVWMDLSNIIIADVVKRNILQAMQEFGEDIRRYCSIQMPGTQQLINLKKPVYGRMVQSFRQFMTPANAVLFEFFLPIMFTVSALLTEKTSGLLQRSLVAGLKLTEMAIGHIVVQTIILVIQTGLLIIVLYYIFDNTLEGDITLWLTLLLLIGICGMLYGTFIAAVCTSFTTASFIALGSYFPLLMLSGAIWPLEGEPVILRYISNILPIAPSVEAFRALSYKHWTIDHPTIYTAFISLSIWSLILSLLTYLSLTYKPLNRK